jgi:hypothetical protein
MIHNTGGMNVVSFLRLDEVALEPPPNDVERFETLPQMMSGLGGKTAPINSAGSFNATMPGQVVAKSTAPPDRISPAQSENLGGSIIATPSPSITRQERQKGLVLRSFYQNF